MQCTTQGLLIPLLGTFLNSKQPRTWWFKSYIIYVNILCITQSAMAVLLGFDVYNPRSPRIVLIAAYPVLTAIIGASVQAFFVHRCWRILKQRTLLIMPLLLLALAALVSGILTGVFSVDWTRTDSVEKNKLALAIWASTTFALDLCMTTITIAFLYRTRTGLIEHKGVFRTIWQIMWASAAPPLFLMIISIVDGYIVKGGSHSVTSLAAAMTGKFFTLSLMINLVGQGYVRQQLEQCFRTDSQPAPPSTSNRSRNHFDRISEPVFAPTAANRLSQQLAEHRSLSLRLPSVSGSETELRLTKLNTCNTPSLLESCGKSRDDE